VRVERSPRVDPLYRRVNSGFNAYRKGDYRTAKRFYEGALSRDPYNRDALLGLAAVDLKTSQYDAAQQRYLTLLAANPRDRVALAALTSLQTSRDPVSSESRLKLLLQQDPDAAYLHFALGNVYALQARWSEAQQAFFKAYASDKTNGDYVYNLAVSLDHMGQGSAALDFYRSARDLAARGPVSFDLGAVDRRVEVLSQKLNHAPS
jgi:tetratricopeptide (TPR) repeat protein